MSIHGPPSKAAIDNLVSKSGDTMTGPLEMSANKITGLGAPSDEQDAANVSYVDAHAGSLQDQIDALVADVAARATLEVSSRTTGLYHAGAIQIQLFEKLAIIGDSVDLHPPGEPIGATSQVIVANVDDLTTVLQINATTAGPANQSTTLTIRVFDAAVPASGVALALTYPNGVTETRSLIYRGLPTPPAIRSVEISSDEDVVINEILAFIEGDSSAVGAVVALDPEGGLEYNASDELKIKPDLSGSDSGVALSSDGLEIVDRVRTAGDTMSGALLVYGSGPPSGHLQVSNRASQTTSDVSDIETPLVVNSAADNGGNIPNGQVPLIQLRRAGVSSEAYGNVVNLSVGRYENASTNARTQLDFELGHGIVNGTLPLPAILSLRSGGDVVLPGPLTLSSTNIRGVANPVLPQDAATKAYVDSSKRLYAPASGAMVIPPGVFTDIRANAPLPADWVGRTVLLEGGLSLSGDVEYLWELEFTDGSSTAGVTGHVSPSAALYSQMHYIPFATRIMPVSPTITMRLRVTSAATPPDIIVEDFLTRQTFFTAEVVEVA